MNYKQSIYLHIFTIIFVLIGSAETVLTNLLNFSVLNIVGNNSVKTLLVIIIGLSVLYHMLNKYTYLPFLNYNVLPYSLFKLEKKENANEDVLVSVDIDIPTDNTYTHLIYWASNRKSEEILPWDLAYGEFTNSGIELVNNKKKLLIKIECPSSYKVPSLIRQKVIPQHVHYRFLSKDGMMSPIYTKYVKC